MTAGDAVRSIQATLAAAGVDDPRLDARLLVAEVLGVEPQRVFLYPEMPLSPEQKARLDALVARRAAREPMSHVLGRRGFWTLELEVSADTLAPRPDTETLVQAVLDRIPDRDAPLKLLDFGTGTGCILLALLSELPVAVGLGVDASPGALAVAERNGKACRMGERVQWRLGDWGSGLDGRFDAIVSNPPYIPNQDIAGLEPEVAQYEPHSALFGGVDGLDCYRVLSPQMARLLAPGGVAAFEVGLGQAGDVAALMEAAGLEVVEIRRDLGGVERCVVAVRSDRPNLLGQT